MESACGRNHLLVKLREQSYSLANAARFTTALINPSDINTGASATGAFYGFQTPAHGERATCWGYRLVATRCGSGRR